MAHFYLVKDYELIEHTADVGIRVKGGDLKELFRNAAAAMFDIIAQKEPHTAQRTAYIDKIIVKQKAEGLEELFVNWLNELLSLSATKERIFSDFTFRKLDAHNLEAVAMGEDVKNYKVNTEIKAATYHQLKLEEAKGVWQAEVIFDV